MRNKDQKKQQRKIETITSQNIPNRTNELQYLTLMASELEKLEKEKTESSVIEEENIHKPYQELVTEITIFNQAATKNTINIIKQKALDWRKREIELKAKIDSLRSQAFNIFGVYDVSLIQKVLDTEPYWWNHFTNTRQQWEQLNKQINNITEEQFILRNLGQIKNIGDETNTDQQKKQFLERKAEIASRRERLSKQFKKINIADFSAEKYYSLFEDWNNIINKLQHETNQLTQEKKEMMFFLIKTVGNANNDISNSKVLAIIKEIFPFTKTEILAESSEEIEEVEVSSKNNEEIEETKVLSENNEEILKIAIVKENQNYKKIMAEQKTKILEKTKLLKKANKELNTSVEIWSKRLNKLKEQFTQYENKHGMSLELNALSIKIITLEAKLNALLEKNNFKIAWYRELPCKFESTECSINEKELAMASDLEVPMVYAEELSQQLEKYKISIKNQKNKLDGENGNIVVVGVRKFELKLGNYGGSFEYPTLLQVPSFTKNGNSNIVVSGDNTVNGHQSATSSDTVDSSSTTSSDDARSLSEDDSSDDSFEFYNNIVFAQMMPESESSANNNGSLTL